jgi:hypothetical protein
MAEPAFASVAADLRAVVCLCSSSTDLAPADDRAALLDGAGAA